MMNETEFLIAFNSAAGAYQADTGGGSLSSWNYNHVETWEDAPTGAKARVYVDESGNYIIAFAGTEDLKDAYQDLANFGMAQWDALSPRISAYFSTLQEQGALTSIQFTGHSLGGALAQYAAYDFVSDEVISPENVSLTTFNALGGEVALLNEYEGEYSRNLLSTANIHHYYDPSDLFSKLTPHLGGQETNYQLRASTDPILTFDAHKMETIQSYIGNGLMRGLQADQSYFEIDHIVPALQIIGEATNGFVSGSDSEVNDVEAVARLISMIAIIPKLLINPSAYYQWDKLKSFLVDNLVVTTLAPKFGITSEEGILSLKVALDLSIQGLGLSIANSRVQATIQAGATLTAFFAETYDWLTGGAEIDPADKALSYSILNYMVGATLSVDENGQFDEKVSEDVASKIYSFSNISDDSSFPALLGHISVLLGQSYPQNYEDAVGLVNHIVENGIHLADFLVSADSYTEERLLNIVNEKSTLGGVIVPDPVDARLVRYAVINHLPFILEGVSSEFIDPVILNHEKYDLVEESDQYWRDRIEFFKQQMYQNADGVQSWLDESDHKYFWDADLGELLVGENTFGLGGINSLQMSDVVNIRFGGDADDPDIQGYGKDDHLYGRDGDDTIKGNAGRDYIEGNADNDTLHGGSESDYLYGGQGDDHLYGDEGNDFLDGGEGADTYYFSNGDGHDIIRDIDAGDRLKINGNLITQIKQPSAEMSVYEDDYGNRFALSQSGEMIITVTDGGQMGTITILDFNTNTNSFGISIDDALPEPDPTDITIGSGHNVVADGSTQSSWLPGRASQSGIVTNKVIYDASLFDVSLFDQDSRIEQWEFWGGTNNDELIGGVENDILHGNLGDDTLVGNAGNDNLNGYEDDDNLSGGLGDDVLVGGHGSDDLIGGEGADFIFGNGPYALINAETGEVISEASSDEGDIDYLEGGEGNDYLSSGRYQDIMLGGAGEDKIFGGAGNDVLFGGAENDVIMGDSAFNRTIYTTTGLGATRITLRHVDHVDKQDANLSYNDTIDGGAGDDTLIGEVGDDVISGGEGNDWIEGDKLNDSSRYGGPLGQYATDYTLGDTTFTVDADDFVEFDILWSGNDTLYGGLGADTIMGNGGDDTLYGGDDGDLLFGDDDLLALENHGNDILYGDAGEDELQGGGGNDELHGGTERDTLFGDTGDDRLYGDEGNDDLLGGDGNDQLYGGAGDDNLWGGDGNDELSGGAGQDILVGGAGDDTYIIDVGDGGISIYDTEGLSTIKLGGGVSPESISVYDSEGNIKINYGPNEDDVLIMSFTTYGRIQTFLGADNVAFIPEVNISASESLIGGALNDALIADISFVSDIIYGGSGDDYIDGKLGADRVYGQSGNDVLMGGGNNDRLYGGVGEDVLVGGDGSDSLYGGDGDDIFIYKKGDGDDIIFADDSSDLKNDLLLLTGGITPEDMIISQEASDLLLTFVSNSGSILVKDFFLDNHLKNGLSAIQFENKFVWGYQDLVDIANLPTDLNDNIQGSDESDIIDGLAGDDTISGLGGNDELYGGSGNDTLFGGDGDDTLLGGQGINSLYGGSGQNTYVFDLVSSTDTIYSNPEGSNDVIKLKDVLPEDIKLLASGNDLKIINLYGNTVTIVDYYNLNALARTSISILFDKNNFILSDTEIRNKVVNGTDQDDFIYGTIGDDVISAYAGNDSLAGGLGDDILDGGTGNDYLHGDEGSDIYIFSLGSGHDVLYSTIGLGHENDVDRVQFSQGIRPSDIRITQLNSRDILVTVSEQDSLTIENFFDFSTNENNIPSNVLDQFVFSNGLVWNVDDIISAINFEPGEGDDFIIGNDQGIPVYGLGGDDRISGTKLQDELYGDEGNDRIQGGAGGDLLYGGAGHDRLEGGHGDDRLYGGDGNDLLTGGDSGDQYGHGTSPDFVFGLGGDDTLIGGSGNDVYRYSYEVGDGHHVIDNTDLSGGFDVLEILLGYDFNIDTDIISISDIGVSFSGDDLILTMGSGSIRINNQFKDSDNLGNLNYSIDEIRFIPHWDNAPYEVWSAAHIAAMRGEESIHNNLVVGDLESNYLRGTQEDNVLVGFDGDDRLVGNEGDDLLVGGEGSDSYIYSYITGDGHDTIDNFDSAGGYDAIEIVLGYDFNIDTDILSTEQISVTYSGDDMILTIGSGSITILNQFKDAGTDNSLYAIDEIRFVPADGITPYEVWTLESMISAKAAFELSDNTFEALGGEVVETLEDQVKVITFDELLANDTGSNLSITSVEGDANANGTYVLDMTKREISFTPVDNFSGQSQFSYTVGDGVQSSVVTASINVNPVNDSPELSIPILDQSATEGEAVTFTVPDDSYTDIDAGDELSYSASLSDGSSLPVWLSFDSSSLTFSGTPSSSDVGGLAIKVLAKDSFGALAEDIFNFSVLIAEDQPLSIIGTRSAEVFHGGSADDYINARGGKDQLFGYEGKDTLIGGGGSDHLYGGDGVDKLRGGGGNDHLYGEAGNDILIGGAGNDHYYFGTGDGFDRINNASNQFATETDSLKFSGVAEEDLWFKKTKNHLDVYLLGSTDRVRVNNWYKEEKFELDRIDVGSSSIDSTGIEQLVNAMASFGAPSGGSIDLTPEDQYQVQSAIAAAWV